MEPMDSLGTWPRPVPADDRDFDVQVMRRLRTAPGEDGAPDRPSLGERLGTSLLLVVPVLTALAVVLLWQQWSRSGSVLYLALVAVVLVGTAEIDTTFPVTGAVDPSAVTDAGWPTLSLGTSFKLTVVLAS